jgi:hypothetical protein
MVATTDYLDEMGNGQGSSPPDYLQLYRGATTDYLNEMSMAPALLTISSCTGVQLLTTWMRWAWLLPS